MDLFATSLHPGGEVTYWDVYRQRWVKRRPASDIIEDAATMATLSPEDRAMIELAAHLARRAEALHKGGEA
jgi:hypothetical protein